MIYVLSYSSLTTKRGTMIKQQNVQQQMQTNNKEDIILTVKDGAITSG